MSLSNFLKEQENISYQQYYYGCPYSKTLSSLRNHILWLRLWRGSDLIAYLPCSKPNEYRFQTYIADLL